MKRDKLHKGQLLVKTIDEITDIIKELESYTGKFCWTLRIGQDMGVYITEESNEFRDRFLEFMRDEKFHFENKLYNL